MNNESIKNQTSALNPSARKNTQTSHGHQHSNIPSAHLQLPSAYVIIDTAGQCATRRNRVATLSAHRSSGSSARLWRLCIRCAPVSGVVSPSPTQSRNMEGLVLCAWPVQRHRWRRGVLFAAKQWAGGMRAIWMFDAVTEPVMSNLGPLMHVFLIWNGGLARAAE
jgi:hypothetical protein